METAESLASVISLASFSASTSVAPWMFVYVGLVVFLAGIVRGVSGFGFSMICVVLLLFILPPAQVTPVILLWEIMASLGHLPFVFRDVNWKAIFWLCVGVFAGSPLGVYLVVTLPVKPMVLFINALILVMTALLLWGKVRPKEPGKPATIGTGIVTGFINAISANGGPPVILFFLASPAGAAVGRASLIAFFFFTDIWASFLYWREGLVSLQTILFMAIFLVPLGFGVALGSRLMSRLDERIFKKIVLTLLFAITSIAFVQSFYAFVNE